MAATTNDQFDFQVPVDLSYSSYQVLCSVAEIIERLQLGARRVLVLGSGVPCVETVAPGAEVLSGEVLFDSADQMSLQPLPHEDGSFDLVAACDVLDQLPDQVRSFFINEIVRVASQCIILVSPFDSSVTVSAEESVSEIHHSSHGRPHPRVHKHLQYGLPQFETAVSAFESATGFRPEALPNTSLRSWALFEMLECVARTFPGGDMLLSRLSSFYNSRLTRFDHTPPCYRRVLLAAAPGRPLNSAAVKSLVQRFMARPVDSEIRAIRELLRLILDSCAEMLSVPAEESHARDSQSHLHELEQQIADQAQIIEQLKDELDTLKKSGNPRSPGRLIKKFFVY
jgi:hypothetical protein